MSARLSNNKSEDVNQFAGRRQDRKEPPLVKHVDEVSFRLQQKRDAAEARKKQKKEEREKKPEPKWTEDEMNTYVLRKLSEAGEAGLTLRDVKRLTKQSDALIRNALKQFGVVSKSFPTHHYVLRDEFKIRRRTEHVQEVMEQFEFESSDESPLGVGSSDPEVVGDAEGPQKKIKVE